MNIYEQVYNLGWIFAGIAICIQSIRLKLWDITSPGGGFIPFLAGLIVGAIGLLMFILECSKGFKKGPRVNFWQNPAAQKRIIFILGGLCAIAYLMPILGFLLSSILVTSFMLRVIERSRWVIVIGLAFAFCFLVYFLFYYLLKVNLPRGFLGI